LWYNIAKDKETHFPRFAKVACGAGARFFCGKFETNENVAQKVYKMSAGRNGMTTDAIENVAEFEKGLLGYPLKYKYIYLTLIETGFRIADVLNLKLRDVRRGKNITEKKTGKRRELLIGEQLRASLVGYAKTCALRDEDFLFPSTKNNLNRPISRYQVYKVFKRVGKGLDLHDKVISPHSCRKTYARLKIENGATVEDLQKDFNHSKRKTTEGYLK
jgi:integrase